MALYNFTNEIWSKRLIKNLDNNAVMLKLVNTDYEGEVKNSGDTVNIRKLDDVQVNNYEGIVNYETLTPTLTTLLIDQEKYYAFDVDDIEDKQSDIEVFDNYTGRAKVQMGLTIDTHLLGKYADVPSANQVDASDVDGGSADAGATLSTDTIIEHISLLYQKMENSNAFVNTSEQPWLVVNPTVKHYLRRAPEYLNLEKEGSKALVKGQVGECEGFRIYSSTNLAAVSSKYYCLAGTKEAITFAPQLKVIETIRRERKFATAVRGLMTYGSKTLQTAALGQIIFSA